MISQEERLFVGVDFGTTNTVVSLCDSAGRTQTLSFSTSQGQEQTFRSLLCYVSAEDGDDFGVSLSQTHCGRAAIEAFLEYGEQARLIQSVKTFLSSQSFSKTHIQGRELTLEHMVADFLKGLMQALGWPHGGARECIHPITVGRPVTFAGGGSAAEEAIAVQRLRTAFEWVGFKDIQLVYEPAAAAYFFSRRLQSEATVLVADFGGGTSDFSIVRFNPKDGSSQPLGHAGVGIAGDRLDFSIIDHVVAPALGKGSLFRPEGKWLEVPKWIYFEFEQWHRLSFLKRDSVLRELKKIELTSDSPEKIANLRLFLEYELGFHLYQEINRCKAQLSLHPSVDFEFNHPPIHIKKTIHRKDFEQWIEPDVRAMLGACHEALDQAGVSVEDISVVFMTGGTSFVPLIRQQFSDWLGPEKMVRGDEFVSVGSGLALLARDQARQR